MGPPVRERKAGVKRRPERRRDLAYTSLKGVKLGRISLLAAGTP